MMPGTHERRVLTVLGFLALGCLLGAGVAWNGFLLAGPRESVFRHVAWAVPALWLLAVPVIWFALFARLSGLPAERVVAQSVALAVLIALIPVTGIFVTAAVLPGWTHGLSGVVTVTAAGLWLWLQIRRSGRWFSG